MLQGKNIRKLYLDYFVLKGHKLLPSSSLIPRDPTVLSTIAGMIQFKGVFQGVEARPAPCATTAQKCIRTNDIERVGVTDRHHTFFEMLGNFSFGDYFKTGAIQFAWEFLIDVAKIPQERLSIAIFENDEEAYEIWTQTMKIPANKIIRLGEDNNFWSSGPTGPCGPCSEIYYDRGHETGCGSPTCAPGCDCDRFLEIWNLVFMQYERDAEGNLTELPKKNIDTGMGLERLTMVLQNVASTYDTDLLKTIQDKVLSLTDKKKDASVISSLRIISDHIRAATYFCADGVFPSNEGRGYVLRKLLRRAVRHGQLLGIKGAFVHELIPLVIAQGEDAYPELITQRDKVLNILTTEESNFINTLEQGLRLLAEVIAKSNNISGADAFKLYDTFGFPLDLTREIAKEKGITVDEVGFNVALENQRQMSRSAAVATPDQIDTARPLHKKGSGGEAIVPETPEEEHNLAMHHTATHLLHAALRQVLGTHVQQSGSLVDTDNLRFDFTHFEQVNKSQLAQVEAIVNDKIRENIPLKIEVKSKEEALQSGAMAFFGDKYGDSVRVVQVPGFSSELCGGHHLSNTGEVEQILILSEGSTAAGIRRIEAITGKARIDKHLATLCKQKRDGLNKLLAEIRQLNPQYSSPTNLDSLNADELDKLKSELEKTRGTLLKQDEQKIQQQTAIKAVAIADALKPEERSYIHHFENTSINALRTIADTLSQKRPDLFIYLAGSADDKLALICKVGKPWLEKGLHAGNIIKETSALAGGSGGGKAEMAQGGGKDVGAATKVIEKIYELIDELH